MTWLEKLRDHLKSDTQLEPGKRIWLRFVIARAARKPDSVVAKVLASVAENAAWENDPNFTGDLGAIDWAALPAVIKAITEALIALMPLIMELIRLFS